MNLIKYIAVLTAAFLSLNSFASDHACRSSYQVSSAAHEVANSANHFHRVIHRLDGYSHLSSDAHRLAEAANHLHRLADRGTRSCTHLRADYIRVERVFQHLRVEFRHAHDSHHNGHIIHDFRELQMSFRMLRRSLRGGHGGGHGGGH